MWSLHNQSYCNISMKNGSNVMILQSSHLRVLTCHLTASFKTSSRIVLLFTKVSLYILQITQLRKLSEVSDNTRPVHVSVHSYKRYKYKNNISHFLINRYKYQWLESLQSNTNNQKYSYIKTNFNFDSNCKIRTYIWTVYCTFFEDIFSR